MGAATAIPTIDLGPLLKGGSAGKRAVGEAIDSACREFGFFTVVNHGVSRDLIASVRAKAVEFFALPVEEKVKVQRPPQKISRGYFRLAERSLAYSLNVAAPPDLQEAFAFGPEHVPETLRTTNEVTRVVYAPNLWPSQPAEFRETMLAYYQAMSGLTSNLMRAMAIALKLDEDYFAGKFARQTSAARLIRYPAVTTTPMPGQLRAGAHTDYGTITLVRGDDVPGGLQIKNPHADDWIDIHPGAEAFVCNIGDLMARWSNDRWVSTLHRVAVPPPQAVPSDRISLVFFQLPDYDAVIRCIETCIGEDGREKYPPVTCAEHYLGKVMKAAHSRLDAGASDSRVT
jgi:isopenicillin N synthase-like dioxygenase